MMADAPLGVLIISYRYKTSLGTADYALGRGCEAPLSTLNTGLRQPITKLIASVRLASKGAA